MLKILEPFLSKKAAPSAADLRAAMAAVDAKSVEAAQKVDELHRARTKGLLNGVGDAELDRIEHNLTPAHRDADRLDLAAEELQKRLAEAEAAEREAKRDVVYNGAVKAQARAIELLRGKFSTLCQELATVAGEIAAAELEVEKANLRLSDAGDRRQVEPAALVLRREVVKVVPESLRPHADLIAPLDRLRLPNMAPSSDEIRMDDTLLWPRRSLPPVGTGGSAPRASA
jgi:hypothetical protein